MVDHNSGGNTGNEYASPLKRILAGLIDYLCAIVVALVIPVAGWFIATAYLLTKDALSFLKGQSVGKMILGLRVVDEQTRLAITNDYGKSIVRGIFVFIPFLAVIELLVMYTHKENHRRLGDKFAHTLVIVEKQDFL